MIDIVPQSIFEYVGFQFVIFSFLNSLHLLFFFNSVVKRSDIITQNDTPIQSQTNLGLFDKQSNLIDAVCIKYPRQSQ